jgi:hypothetical protein
MCDGRVPHRQRLGPIFNYHCSRCRRWHGGIRTRASIRSEQFSWVKGKDLVKTFHSSEFTAKHFCSICGSNLISTYDNDPSRVSIPLGGLDQAPTNRPEGHFFVASKAPWYEITDGLPQHDIWPGSRADVRKTRNET